MKTICRVVLFTFLCTGNAFAEIKPLPHFDYVEALFPGCTRMRCVISEDNWGGFIMPFETAMHQIVERDVLIIEIDAICNSMCASIMDRIREFGVSVCMTSRGVFGFHESVMFKTDENDNPIFDEIGERIFDHYEDLPQTPKVQQWIKSKGGAPVSSGYETNLHLEAHEAAVEHLFELCPSNRSATLGE